MLSRLFWRHILCRHIIGSHTRDWYGWDALGLSKCLHCRRDMPEPPFERRERL